MRLSNSAVRPFFEKFKFDGVSSGKASPPKLRRDAFVLQAQYVAPEKISLTGSRRKAFELRQFKTMEQSKAREAAVLNWLSAVASLFRRVRERNET